MAMPMNPATPIIRRRLEGWIKSKRDGFTLAQACYELSEFFDHLHTVECVSKSLSNELIRLVNKGLLAYTVLDRKGEPGRPPRLYKQVH